MYSGKVVVFGQKRFSSGKSRCIRTKRLYSGRVVVFVQSGCNIAKWLYSGKSCCNRAKRLYSGKIGCNQAKWLYSCKVVVIG